VHDCSNALQPQARLTGKTGDGVTAGNVGVGELDGDGDGDGTEDSGAADEGVEAEVLALEGLIGKPTVGSGDASWVLLGLPSGTKASEMEIVCTWKAPSLAYRLGKASAGFWVKAEVRSTAASVACDGVADTVFPGGKTMEALRIRLAEEGMGVMVVATLSGAVACLMDVDRS